MTRTDNGPASSRSLAQQQEMQDRNHARLIDLIAELTEQVSTVRLGQERLSIEMAELKALMRTKDLIEESKVWRQWAQNTMTGTTTMQKELMDRLTTLFSLSCSVGTPAAPPQMNLAAQQMAYFQQVAAMQQAQRFSAAHHQQQAVPSPLLAAPAPAPVAPAPVQVVPAPKPATPAPVVQAVPIPPQAAPASKPAVPVPVIQAAPVPVVKTEPKIQGWGDKFKPKPGSWECKGCYVRQDAEVATCPACGTNKDGTVSKPDPFAKGALANPAKPGFSFKSMGSSATTPATTAEPAKTWQFSFNPSASPAAATTVAPVATPVAKPLFSFSTSTTSAAPAGGTENKIFGAQSSKTSFDSVSGADIFAGKTSSASSFGDPKDFKFGQAKTVSPQKPAGDHENEDAEDEYEPDAHFEPVVPLPSLVEVKTGEEEEEVLFSERARLYRFVPETKEYKERGTGDIKVLHNPKSNSYRVVMRREQVLKLCANFRLVAGMKAQTRNDGKPTCMFSATDFAEVPEGEQLTLTVRFRTEENRNGFVKFFEQGVEAAASRQGQLVNSPSETPEAQKEEEKPNKEDEEEIPVFEIEVTASLNPAYKSPLKPAKSVKDARIRLVCMYEELAGVGDIYRIYFYDKTSKALEFSHYIRDDINLEEKEQVVRYTTADPNGVTYHVEVKFDSAEDEDIFNNNFHEGVILVEGEGDYDEYDECEDEEDYEEYEYEEN